MPLSNLDDFRLQNAIVSRVQWVDGENVSSTQAESKKIKT
jgi:hypothetical protein